jgi:predicted RNA-binding protein with PIN domain
MRDALSPAPDDPPAAELWLVDGYNALHAALLGGSQSQERRQAWWQAEQRQRLIDRVSSFRDRAASIHIVFDGSRPVVGSGKGEGEGEHEDAAGTRVAVVFAPSADDWLVAAVREDQRPERIAVVTGDRQVAGRCRHAGAAVIGPRTFLAYCEG